MHGKKFNLIILGDGAVGKTSLLSMYKNKTMNMAHVKTIGIDHVTTGFSVDGHNFTVKIWDTAG
jgi:Ras-related protein Rab-34